MMKDKVTFLSFNFPIYEVRRPYKAERERIENLPIITEVMVTEDGFTLGCLALFKLFSDAETL